MTSRSASAIGTTGTTWKAARVAKAYRLLDDIDLGPDLDSAREGPHLAFEEGAYPGDNSRWVQANGKLALSLLQARLIDLNLPIGIAKGAPV